MLEIMYEALSGALYVVTICLILVGIVSVLVLKGEHSYKPIEPKVPVEVEDPYKNIRPAINYMISKENKAALSKAGTAERSHSEEYLLPKRVILDTNIGFGENKASYSDTVGRPTRLDKKQVKRQIPGD